jgi:tetratricopeptide (TPR) repeat protein
MNKLSIYETWFDQGITLQESDKHAEALACFQKAIEMKPDFIPAWVYQGISLEQLERYDEALASFDEAIEINPNVTDLWYNKGATLCQLQRYEDAMTCFDKVLEIDPNNAIAQTARSLTFSTLESLKQAQKSVNWNAKPKQSSNNVSNTTKTEWVLRQA